MTIERQAALWRRSSARRLRRVMALIAYCDTHPDATRDNDAELRRLDDLVGEADQLRRRL